jgi:hypothetical protein
MKPHIRVIRTCIHKPVTFRKRCKTPPADQGIIPALPQTQGPERSVSFQQTLADLSDGDDIDSLTPPPPASHYDTHPPKFAMAFHSPFKLGASCISARETHKKKDSSKKGGNKKTNEDDLFITNALERYNRF